jgi:hypothetical protein
MILTVAAAQELIEPVYEDRRDKMGYQEIEHVQRVAAYVDASVRPIALLHDVVEDGLYTFRQLYPLMGINQFETLLLITRDGTLTYQNYIRLLTSERDRGSLAGIHACAIKEADLYDNMTRKGPSNMEGMKEPGGRYWRAWMEITGLPPDFLG